MPYGYAIEPPTIKLLKPLKRIELDRNPADEVGFSVPKKRGSCPSIGTRTHPVFSALSSLGNNILLCAVHFMCGEEKLS